MKKIIVKWSVIGGIFLVIAILFAMTTYQVKPNEYHLISAFGKINRVESTPGLKFKIPFVEKDTVLPKNIQSYDLALSEVITSDKKSMIVDSFALWQIEDPIKFKQTLNGSITNAETRIETLVYNAIQSVISSTKQEKVISGRDGTLESSIMKAVGDQMSQYGIKNNSIETKRLDLPEVNKKDVYSRMISERAVIEAEYIVNGEFNAKKIKNETNKTVEITVSNAEAEAEKIIAEGEAEYMKTLANMYDTPDKRAFYEYQRELEMLKNSISKEGNTIILDPNSPIVKMFYK